jgi:hypothetical protein
MEGSMPKMLLALLLFILANSALGATVYKWVDDQGGTHYGATPPPDRKAEEIHPKSSAPAAGAGDAQHPQESWQDQEREFLRRRAQRKEDQWQKEQAEARAKQEEAARKESCIAARGNLQILRQGRPVYQLDEKGERKYLTDAERKAQIEQSQRDIERYCPPAGN